MLCWPRWNSFERQKYEWMKDPGQVSCEARIMSALWRDGLLWRSQTSTGGLDGILHLLIITLTLCQVSTMTCPPLSLPPLSLPVSLCGWQVISGREQLRLPGSLVDITDLIAEGGREGGRGCFHYQHQHMWDRLFGKRPSVIISTN